jgi:hypothetical protein
MKRGWKPAIAMIELIFAIVIMSIALISAPMLISTATKSSFVAIQQEAINEAASQINMVMGYHWDEQDANDLYLDPILVVSAQGDPNLNAVAATFRRTGTPLVSKRSFIREDGLANIPATVPLNLGSDAGEPPKDDVDDFIGNTSLINIANAASDYVEGAANIQINTQVAYMNDRPTPADGTYTDPGADRDLEFSNLATTAAGSTNIKHITVTLTDNSGLDEFDKTITLNAFVCNIGAYELEKKAF